MRRVFLAAVMLLCASVPQGRGVAHTLPPATLPTAFVYAGTENGHIYQFRAAADGTLSPLKPAVLTVGKESLSLVAHPNGRFVYAASGNSANVYTFRVAGDGHLSLLSPPIPCRTALAQLFVHTNGKYLYAAVDQGKVLRFGISGDGHLTRLSAMSVEGGTISLVVQEPWTTDTDRHYCFFSIEPEQRFVYGYVHAGFLDSDWYTLSDTV